MCSGKGRGFTVREAGGLTLPLALHDLVTQPFSDSWCESKMRFTTCYLVGPE